MKIVLQIVSGPYSGRSIAVPRDGSVKIGRSAEADFSIHADPEMSSLHFEVSSNGEQGHLRDLDSTNGTFLNQQQVAESELQDGDHLRAGRSEFSVFVDSAEGAPPDATTQFDQGPGEDAAKPQPSPALPGVETGAEGLLALTAAEIAAGIEFEQDESRALVQEGQSPREYLDALTQKGHLSDALRFLACALPKRHAVWWACRCVRSGSGEKLSEAEGASLAAAEKWVAEPSEENRRAAMAAAETAGFDTAAGWPAVAAFWSSGSMGPPEAPDIPPADDMTPKAAAGAVLLAAVLKEPEKAEEKQQSFLDDGLALAQTETPWEQK